MTKYSISSYVADGTTTDFLITWDYLDTAHITVFVNGTNVADAGSGFVSTLINPTTVRVTTELAAAPPNGAIIEIRRQTPINTSAVTFFDGSSLNGEDLNKNTNYLLYAMQEALDTVDAAAQDSALAAQTATEGFRDEAEVFRNQAETFSIASSGSATLASTKADEAAASAASIDAATLVRIGNNLSDLSDAAAARTNLGLAIGTDVQAYDATILNAADIGVSVQAYDAATAKLNVAQSFTAAQRGSTQVASITGATVLNFNTNQNFVLTLTGNVTLDNPTTEVVGQSGFIVFVQDATGGRTVSLGTDYETAAGAGLTLSAAANATDIVPYIVVADGRILLGSPQLAFA